jgi:hypothetical protein
MNEKPTFDELESIIEESMFGCSSDTVCVCCWNQSSGLESDATWHTCEECKAPAVFGAGEMIHLLGNAGNVRDFLLAEACGEGLTAKETSFRIQMILDIQKGLDR